MELIWQSNAWEDYLYWQEHDRKILYRINELIKECLRNPLKGSENRNRSKEIFPGAGAAGSLMSTG